MPNPSHLPSLLVSPRVYALIATSPRLSDLLIPEGPQTSPYEVLDYDATLTLHDPTGMHATFGRTEWIRFLQDGVGAVLDHAWGDGLVLAWYHTAAGTLGDSFRDQGRRHQVIVLPRPMAKGETARVQIRRDVVGGFTQREEWLETTVDHPIRRLRRTIVFPKARPCLRATLHVDRHERELPIIAHPDGHTAVRFTIRQAAANTPYTVTWSW